MDLPRPLLAIAAITIASDLSEEYGSDLDDYTSDEEFKVTLDEINTARLLVPRELNFDFLSTVSYDYHEQFFHEISDTECLVTKGILFALFQVKTLVVSPRRVTVGGISRGWSGPNLGLGGGRC